MTTAKPLLLREIAFHALRLLINALRPTHCPTCGTDLHLSPTTNLAPKLERVLHPVEILYASIDTQLDEKADDFLLRLQPAMEELAEKIAKSGKTSCAELPLYPQSDSVERATDPASGLSLITAFHRDLAGETMTCKFAIGLA